MSQRHLHMKQQGVTHLCKGESFGGRGGLWDVSLSLQCLGLWLLCLDGAAVLLLWRLCLLHGPLLLLRRRGVLLWMLLCLNGAAILLGLLRILLGLVLASLTLVIIALDPSLLLWRLLLLLLRLRGFLPILLVLNLLLWCLLWRCLSLRLLLGHDGWVVLLLLWVRRWLPSGPWLLLLHPIVLSRGHRTGLPYWRCSRSSPCPVKRECEKRLIYKHGTAHLSTSHTLRHHLLHMRPTTRRLHGRVVIVIHQ